MTIFTAFNFHVDIRVDGDDDFHCESGFSTCDGLEMSATNKSIRSGGDNWRTMHLGGPVSTGTLVLKRGMTSSFDLWRWFEKVHSDGHRHLRATIEVTSLGSRPAAEQATWILDRCLPVRLRVPGFDAAAGQLAIEELQAAYETIRLRIPEGTNNG